MEYELLNWDEVPSDGELMKFHDELSAKHFLEQLLQEPMNRNRLQDSLWWEPGFGNHGFSSDQKMIGHIASRLVSGNLKMVERVQRLTPGGIPLGIWEPGGKVDKGAEAEVDQEPELIKGTHWSSLKVLDDVTDQPVEGVKLMVRLPDGSQKEYTTNSSGIIEINELERGDLDVSSNMQGVKPEDLLSFVQSGSFSSRHNADAASHEPLSGSCITRVETHKVKKGETLASISKKAKITWQQLAEFNWGTSNPDKVNSYLYLKVGCRKKRETDDTYVFDDSDDPGIIYVPKPWERKGLSLDRIYTFRVKKINQKEPFQFSL